MCAVGGGREGGPLNLGRKLDRILDGGATGMDDPTHRTPSTHQIKFFFSPSDFFSICAKKGLERNLPALDPIQR